MSSIFHVQYMQKTYGGSETLISLLKRVSVHSHNVGFAQKSSKIREGKPFYEQVVDDFEAFIANLTAGHHSLIHTHFVFSGYFAEQRNLLQLCSSHCLFSREFLLAVHDTSNPNEMSSLTEASNYFAALEAEFYPKVRNLVTHSRFHQQELQQLGAESVFLEYPLNVADFDLGLTKKQAKEKIGVPDKTTLLFLGRPTYLKGFSVLAQAFSELAKSLDIQMLVVGHFNINDGYLSYTPAVGASEDGSKASFYVGKNIFVMPPTLHDSVPLYHNAADIFVCPSFYEALGIVNLEAMASCTPVIGSNVAGIPFIINDGETGLLFETGNHFDLMDKIIFLIENPEKASSMAKAAKAYVQEYDYLRVVAKYDNLYDKLTRG